MISEDEIIEKTTKGEIAFPVLLLKQIDRIAQARSNVASPNLNNIKLREFKSTVDTLEDMLAPYQDNEYKMKWGTDKYKKLKKVQKVPKKCLPGMLNLYDDKFSDLMKLMQRKNFLVEESVTVEI